MKRCHRCQREWVSAKRQPGVKEFCEGCAAYLHCCRNCRHFAPTLHNQCAIPTTEWVGDKEGANFCDEFEFVDRDDQKAAGAGEPNAKASFENLFGQSETPSSSEQMDRFKKLFDE